MDVPERAYIDDRLGVYELNRYELLRDVFIWTYERSCQRYAAVRQSLGEPNQFRLRYRKQLMQIVQTMVQQQLSPKVEVANEIAAKLVIPTEHLDHFVRELLSLHEGNFVRYRLRPSEFFAWAAQPKEKE